MSRRSSDQHICRLIHAFSATVALIIATVSACPLSALAQDAGTHMIVDTMRANRLVELVDGRCYLHCHNFPRRTKCHKAERLPELWLATKPVKPCARLLSGQRL